MQRRGHFQKGGTQKSELSPDSRPLLALSQLLPLGSALPLVRTGLSVCQPPSPAALKTELVQDAGEGVGVGVADPLPEPPPEGGSCWL